MHRLTHMFNLRPDARKLMFSLKKSPKNRTRVITEERKQPKKEYMTISQF